MNSHMNAEAERQTRLVIYTTVGFSALGLAYFFGLNHGVLSTHGMSAIFKRLLLIDDARTAWLTALVTLIACFFSRGAVFGAASEYLARRIFWLCAFATATLAIMSLLVYQNDALSMDEYAAVFQSKIFAAGKITGHLPPSVVDWLIPPGFNGAFLVVSRVSGAAMEAYWPGFALLLAPFQALGMPWLCNPLLTACALYLIYRITLEITGKKSAGGFAALLALASGAYLATGLSLYSMQAHLAANLLFAWLLMRSTPGSAVLAGIVGSFALILHNPFPHTMFAVPWLLELLRTKERRRLIVPVALGYLPLLVAGGVAWLSLRSLVTAGDSGFDVLGKDMLMAFRLPDRLMLDTRVASSVKLWLWAVPGLLPLAVLGYLRFSRDWRVRLLSASALLTFIAYCFVTFDQGHGWGYRYFHPAWGVLPILAGCALASEPRGRLAAFAGAAALLNLVLVIPVQFFHMRVLIDTHSAQLPPAQRPGRNVYILQPYEGFYLGDLVQTDPFLRNEDLVLLSRDPKLDAELIRQNWPQARHIANKTGVEQWQIGEADLSRFKFEAEAR